MITVAENLKVGAGTQFTNFDFTSMIEWNGKFIGSKTDGIYEIGGSNGDDDGVDIDAKFAILKTNLGTSNQKRLRRGYVGHEADGTLYLTVYCDDVAGTPKMLTPEETAQGGSRWDGVRSQKGEYWMLEVGNVDGCDFSVDFIQGVFVNLGKKPSGSFLHSAWELGVADGSHGHTSDDIDGL